MDLAEDAYRELQDFFRWFDRTHTREQEVFTKLGYIDVQHLAPRIKAEVQIEEVDGHLSGFRARGAAGDQRSDVPVSGGAVENVSGRSTRGAFRH